MPFGFFRPYLRLRIRHGKDDRIPRHTLDVLDSQDPRHRKADEDVGALKRVAELALDPAGVGGRGDPPLHEVHALLAPAINRAVLVDADDVAHAARLEDLDRGRARGANAGDDDADPPEVLLYNPKRVEQRGEDDDGGAVLVVVEYGDVELLAEALLDLEAAGCGDILEVDAAEGRGDELDGLDDFVDILRREADREGVHAPELLEQHRLAFHHRERRLRPNIAQAEHRRTVGDHGDHVLLDRQRERARSIVADRQADPGDPRRVHHREVVTGADRHFVVHLDLSPAVHQEGPVGDVADADAGDVAEPGDDLLGVDAVASLDGDVALRPVARGLDEVD